MKPLNLIALCTFAASTTIRCLDPVLPQIAGDFKMDNHAVAILATAYALPYAFIQPILGLCADVIGKARIIVYSLLALAVFSIVAALVNDFHLLFAARVICGATSGGIFPVALALAGDLVPVQERQVAMGRILGLSMAGNLLGSTAGGIIGDIVSWHGVLIFTGALVAIAFAVAWYGMRELMNVPRSPFNLAQVIAGYKDIFSNPNARVCYPAVLIEGICLFGVFPYVASFLMEAGEPRSSIAGLVIAGFAVGGVIYGFAVPLMLRVMSINGLMVIGALIMGAQFIAIAYQPHWAYQVGVFMVLGIAFYMLHGSLQVFASELAPHARASSVAWHATFFFIGQAAGPVLYGYGLGHAGRMPTLIVVAIVLAVLGAVCALLLRHRGEESAV